MPLVEVLAVPGCPHAADLTERLERLLGGRGDITITRRVVTDADQAQATGMAGSPTVLVDGRDPFADDDGEPSLSCRLYRDEHGRMSGTPSLDQLRCALTEHGDF